MIEPDSLSAGRVLAIGLVFVCYGLWLLIARVAGRLNANVTLLRLDTH